MAAGYLPPLEITSVVWGSFGLPYGAQPGGVGIATVRSVRVFGATGTPVTPMPSRYFANGTGRAAVVVLVAVVVKIDWKSGGLGAQAETANAASAAAAAPKGTALTKS